jgi:hypothetical protein
MAILALQAYIAYFGTSLPAGAHRLRYVASGELVHLQSRHRRAVEIMRDVRHDYPCAAGLAESPGQVPRAGAP